MKIEVGMYVRTKAGIGKIDETEMFMGKYFQFHLDSNKGTIHNVTHNTYWNKKEDIIGEPSYNIMDLIEAGDYVNGEKVAEVLNKPMYHFGDGIIIKNEYGEDIYSNFRNSKYESIKSIVTKEQFAAMEYKVEGDEK